ncbi:MAG: hypothetical protein BZ138_06735 [Methanosphaera sp. rholeuAM270]|nr:MAG: hypothetical protein BZ138_06735 [Methanosphaera sp. rholeuAM270]
MNLSSIFSGNACFLVKYEDNKDSKSNFITFLEEEGFRKTIGKYNASHSNWLYINVNSMVYGGGPNKACKLTGTIVGEDPPNAFNVDEFKTIWNIIKKYKVNKETVELIDNSLVSCGNSSFLIKDDINGIGNKFWDFLEIHKFESLDDLYYDWGWVLVNVYGMVYTTNPRIISSCVGNLPSDALSIEEFKVIWDIIIKHKDDVWNIENYLDDCESAYKKYDYKKVLEISNKILKLDKSNEKGLEYKILSLYNLKKYKEALKYLDEAIKINPDNYLFYNIKAFIFTDLYKSEEAVDCYNKSFVLGGFDKEDSLLEYRAKCYLKKAREDHYLKNDKVMALKSLNVYLKQFPEDRNALNLKQELTQDYAPFKYAEKLFYFETKANELYNYGLFEESYACYKDVLKASTDFKKNVPNIPYLGYDFVNRCTIYELENFKWYDEILLTCLQKFNENYKEFFEKLYEISDETIDACLDKAKLYSKVYDDDVTVNYVKKLIQKCPENEDVKEFYDKIRFIQKVYEVESTCHEFKDYNNIEEYIEDVILCVIAHFSYYDEESARKVVNSADFVKEAYENKWAASEVAWEFVILP